MLYSLREGLPERCAAFFCAAQICLCERNGRFYNLDDGRSWCIILSLLFWILSFWGSLAAGAIPEVNDTKLKEREEADDPKAKRFVHCREIPRIANKIGTAAYAAAASSILFGMTALFSPLYRLFFSVLGKAHHTAAVLIPLILAAWVVTILVLGIGILLPRAIGEHFADKLGYSVAGIVPVYLGILSPITAPARGIAWFLARVFGADPKTDPEAVTEEEIRMLVDTGSEMGFIEESQKEMINNIFEFDDTTVGDVMTHRTEVIAVEKDAGIQEVIDLAIQEGFSRLPVYEGDMDNILGFIHVKDLLCLVGRPSEGANLLDFIRPVIYVPEHVKCRNVFAEFKKSQTAMAVVVDEYGGTEGILTMEDILESIVGDIEDEYDEKEKEIQQLDADTYLVEGTTELEDLGEVLDIHFEEDEAYDTLGGFLTHMLGRIPKEDENPSVEYEGYRFTVLQVEERRVAKVRIFRLPAPVPEETEKPEKPAKKEKSSKHNKPEETE